MAKIYGTSKWAEEGSFKDDILHNYTDIVDAIKNAPWGVDVREAMAQMLIFLYSTIQTMGDNFSIDMSPTDTFENLAKLKEKYPNGQQGVFVVQDTGHWYFWSELDEIWKDGGAYQAAGIYHTAGLHALTGFVIGAGTIPNFTYERGHDESGWTDAVTVTLPSTIHVITLTDNDNGKFNRFPIAGGQTIAFNHDEYLYVDVQTKTVGTGNVADLRNNHSGALIIGYNIHGTLMSNNIINLISPNEVLEESMSGWIEPGTGNDVKIIYGNSNDYTIQWNNNIFMATFPRTYGTNNAPVNKIVSTNEQNEVALPSLNTLVFDKSDNKIKAVSDLRTFIQQGHKSFYYLVYNHYGTLVGPWAKFLNQNYQKVTGNRVYFNTGYTVSFKKAENNYIELTFDGSVMVADYTSKAVVEKVNLLNTEKTLHIAPTENLVYNKKTKCLEVKTLSDFVKSEDDLIYLLTNQYQELVGPWASYYDKERISNLESEVQSLSSKTASIPNYYFENNYINDKVEAIKQANDFVNGVSFFYITDSHFRNNARQAKSLLKYLQATTNVSTTIFGGDIVRAFGTEDDINQDVKSYLDLATNSTSNFYALRGNHDLTIVKSESDSTPYSKDDAYTYNIFQRSNELNLIGVSGKNYWYLDNERQKCRFIAIDGFERTDMENTNLWSVKYFISTEQLKWLANVALNVDEGYKVVIFSHATFDPSLFSYERELLPAKQIIEAFKHKTTAHVSNANDSGELDVDFTKTKGEFVASFSGHSHRDQNATTNGILSINTYCDAAYLDDPNYKGNRHAGTINEQCFDAVSIDFDLKKITCIRIGAGANEVRVFNY